MIPKPRHIPSYQSPADFVEAYSSQADGTTPINGLGNEWGVGVYSLEAARQWFRFPIAPNRGRFFDGLLVTGGTIRRQVGLYEATLVRNSLMLVAEAMINATEFVSDDITGFYFQFERAFFVENLAVPSALDDNPFFQPAQEPVVTLTDEQADFLKRLLVLLEGETKQGQTRSITARALLQALIGKATELYCQRSEPRPASTADDRLSAGFRCLVQQHHLSWHGVSVYAAELAVTSNHLNRVIKRTTGRPASQYITDWVMLESKVLLKNTALSIAEIAVRVGFKDLSHFSRFFRTVTGLSPTAYRQLT